MKNTQFNLSNGDLVTLGHGISMVPPNSKGTKFSLAVIKNKEVLKTYKKSIEKELKLSEKLEEYSKEFEIMKGERNKLIAECKDEDKTEKLDKEFNKKKKALDKKYEVEIKAFKDKEKKLMEKKVDVKLWILDESELPDDLSIQLISGLSLMLNLEGK